MAGIYIHIPFCKQACNYCNFYFSTSLHFKKNLVKAIVQEIKIQRAYLDQAIVESVYFGGGTPSILDIAEIEQILVAIQKNYTINNQAEITLEANPDDLSLQKTRDLHHLGVNRLSIGTQSFHEVDLKFMKRAHNAKEAFACIEYAAQVGFKDLSIDLIYGVPTQNEASWLENLEILDQLDINHLSSYALTVEENTPLYHEIRKGKVAKVDDNLAAQHFKVLQYWAELKKWEHYEISNLAKNKNYSKHNTSYWQGKNYLGIGPAAHSFDGESRQWNISNIKKYIDSVHVGNLVFEREVLTKENQFNEKIMTSLRTSWGLDLQKLEKDFPNFYLNFEKQLQQINPTWLKIEKERVRLSIEGRFYSDGIAADLFCE